MEYYWEIKRKEPLITVTPESEKHVEQKQSTKGYMMNDSFYMKFTNRQN